jgi:hypothetical protein
MNTRNITLVLLVVLAAFSRLIPHPANFTAVGAMALFGGAYFSNKKVSVLLPLIALIISDLAIGFHSSMFAVYAAFAFIGMIGWSLNGKLSVARVGGTSLLASFAFFLISNFGVWVSGELYAMNFEGLVQCYVMAIPFFGNQILGDVFFSGVLFAGYEFARLKIPALA